VCRLGCFEVGGKARVVQTEVDCKLGVGTLPSSEAQEGEVGKSGRLKLRFLQRPPEAMVGSLFYGFRWYYALCTLSVFDVKARAQATDL
jgi:hypothetical protein